ncbi:MAG: uracil-xanthine permease family protein [Desulfovibrio sp.]|uniref:Uracil-xanthine permease n=1 Tax=Desulfovibrio porci TaxID=2605782 RepID=A0A6L5XHI1_9BACT|nr:MULTISPECIES: uracil-xanthine permease family protein [Desulfovibrio]MCD7982720.1 uracil-xanthine permease family protein [Desulfovibrio sp.]MDY3809015.1 uracil-xanthine permease family protein [Desulfovibrio porci]MSS26635.1 uracil-xanthine permease [Desulfovibrio porci]
MHADSGQHGGTGVSYNFRFRDCLLGAQMLFVAFGSLVLVPLLTGLNSNVALFTAGVGTLIFQICTRGKVPIFLASSFAFIAPIIYGAQTWGMAQTLGGLFCSGLVYVLLSLLIRWRGMGIILRLLPPIVTGPVIVVIGLVLAPVAVNMALGKSGDGAQQLVPENTAMIISMASLAATVLVSLLGRGFLRLVPILCGIAVGFAASLALGVGGWEKVLAAPWLAVPAFTFPEFSLEPILFIIPITLAPAIEHFGDVIAISSVTGKDYLKDPGIKNTMLGDGIATMAACAVGGPPNTTYSEVTGAVTLTRAFNPAVMTWAALCAILLSFLSKLGAFLSSIPTPVMGGIMILLFGAIMVVGLNTLVRAREDLMEARNMVIVALIIIFGVGGMQFSIGSFKLGGIGLAAVTGVLLNLFLPQRRE